MQTVRVMDGVSWQAIPPDSHRADRRFVARLFPLFPHVCPYNRRKD